MNVFKKFDEKVLSRLILSYDESISYHIRLAHEKKTEDNIVETIFKYLIITSRRLVIFKYFMRSKNVEIKANIFFDELKGLDLKMKHYKQNKEPLLYIAATKSPVLSLKTNNDVYELSLKGSLSLKEKVNQLIEHLKQANPEINVNLNYRKDDLNEAHREIFFEGIDRKGKKRIIVSGMFLLIVLSFAI